MADFDVITVHCSATPPSRDIGVAEIRQWHRAKGWRDIGYHEVIRLDGSHEWGRPTHQTGAHVQGFNRRNRGICLIGGVDHRGRPKNTFTPAQLATLEQRLRSLFAQNPRAVLYGHRDWPGVAKACPSFDVRSWWDQRQAARDRPTPLPPRKPAEPWMARLLRSILTLLRTLRLVR